MPYIDPAKQKAYIKKWNAAFYAKNRAATYARVRARRVRIRLWLDEYKAKLACSKCKESHPACLDFHHKDGKTKEFSLGNIGSWGYGKERLLREIGKCTIMCSNCHRKEHHKLKKK